MAEYASSIVEVAKRAGVSIATASRVLSQTAYPVADTTRRKVLRAAKELDYTPNPMARGLRSRRSHLIAVLVGDNTDPYFAEIMRGVEDVASEFGYLTIMCNSERKPERELHYLRILRDYRTDGILFAGGGLNEPGYPERLETVVQEILARGAAVVTLAQHTLTVPSIQPDNLGGARRMTDYLLRLGHRRIAFVSGPANVTAADARLLGYRAALEHAGRPVEHDLVLPGNFDRASGEVAAEGVARREAEARPTAIFAANDETAIGVLSGLARLGVAVPGDISVGGFGDLPVAQIVAPSLTTVRIELRALGRAGARALLAQLRHEDVAQMQVLPTTIVERASTAPPTSVKRLRDG
jgi:LacI family transcriptional regulator